jgi:hypothetical protein
LEGVPMLIRRMNCKSQLMYCALLLLMTVISPSYGQPAGPQDVENLYHWSYSAAFGTGAYRVGEERVFVLRLSPKVPLARVTEKQVSLNLNLLFAVGGCGYLRQS